MRKSSIYVEVDIPSEDVHAAMVIIARFLEKNNLKINLSISYNYEMEECGVYRPFEKGQEYRIFVNPSKCKTQEDVIKQEFEEPFAPGSPCDITIFGIIIHEFCHLLQYRTYPSIIKNYGETFPTERLNLNEYSNNEIHDEIAEIMTLYITNPYLLKLLSKLHFDFCKKYFKSPISCSPKRCAFIYKGWPLSVKEYLKDKWGIAYNIATKKFVRSNEKVNCLLY